MGNLNQKSIREDINQNLYLIKSNIMYGFVNLLYAKKDLWGSFEKYIRIDYAKNINTILGHYLIALKKGQKRHKTEYGEGDKSTEIQNPYLYVESIKLFFKKYRKEIKLSRDTLYINLCLGDFIVSSRDNNSYVNNQSYLCDKIKYKIKKNPKIKKVRFVVNLDYKEYKEDYSRVINNNAKKFENLIKKIKDEILQDVGIEQKKEEDIIQKRIDKDLLILFFCKNVILEETGGLTQVVLDTRRLIQGKLIKENLTLKLNLNKQLNQAVNDERNIFGFFSLCSIHLFQIIENIKNDLPEKNIKFKQFKMHQEYSNKDIRELVFEDVNTNINIELLKNDDYILRSNNIFYRSVDGNKYTNLIKRWFKPRREIKILKNLMVEELNLETNDTLAVYYRGTDTTRDRIITNYNEFTKNVKRIIENYKNIKLIYLQTDDKMFEDYFLTSNIDKKILITSYLKSEYSHNGQHFTIKENKIFHIQKMIASVLLMSQCKYIICNASNVSRWINFYREGKDRFFQMKGNVIFPPMKS